MLSAKWRLFHLRLNVLKSNDLGCKGCWPKIDSLLDQANMANLHWGQQGPKACFTDDFMIRI